MADKTELQLKAAEKRLDAIERTIETLRKESNSNDSAAQLKTVTSALTSRIDALAATVKELGVQMVLKKDIKAEFKLSEDERDREGRAMEIRLQTERKAAMDKADKEAKAAEQAIKAEMDKMVSESILNLRLQKLELMSESRMKTFEAMTEARLKVLESKK